MPKLHVVTYGVRRFWSTPRMVQGCGVTRRPGTGVPSPQAGEAEYSGLLDELFCHLESIPLSPVSALPVNVIAPALSLPPVGPATCTPPAHRGRAGGVARNPDRLPTALNESKLACSYRRLPPARMTVLPLPVSSHAKPSLGEKFL